MNARTDRIAYIPNTLVCEEFAGVGGRVTRNPSYEDLFPPLVLYDAIALQVLSWSEFTALLVLCQRDPLRLLALLRTGCIRVCNDPSAIFLYGPDLIKPKTLSHGHSYFYEAGEKDGLTEESLKFVLDMISPKKLGNDIVNAVMDTKIDTGNISTLIFDAIESDFHSGMLDEKFRDQIDDWMNNPADGFGRGLSTVSGKTSVEIDRVSKSTLRMDVILKSPKRSSHNIGLIKSGLGFMSLTFPYEIMRANRDIVLAHLASQLPVLVMPNWETKFLAAKYGHLAKSIATEDLAGEVSRLFQVYDVPDLHKIARLATNGSLDFVEFRQSSEEFRKWLHQTMDSAPEDQPDYLLAQAVRQSMRAKWHEQPQATVLRFVLFEVLATLANLAVPFSGVAISAFNTFLAERLILEKTPQIYLGQISSHVRKHLDSSD